MNFTNIRIPEKLAQRPRDTRGYPVPAGVLVDAQGKPDFKTTDVSRWVYLVKQNRCGLCGEPLGRHKAFIGGPKSHESRLFTDLPMHRDCARYALQVCPYLAAPRFKYAETLTEHEGFIVSKTDIVSTVRPDKFCMAIATDYQVRLAPDNTPVLQATPWTSTEWWSQGKLLAEEQAVS